MAKTIASTYLFVNLVIADDSSGSGTRRESENHFGLWCFRLCFFCAAMISKAIEP